MALDFIVEDGSGKPNATSYVSVEEADSISELNFHTHPTWAALTLEQKQNLLMLATKALDVRTKWVGTRTTENQALCWPRIGVKDESGNSITPLSVPYNVRMAVVEFAKWSATSDKISTDTPDNVVREIKVDSIGITFADASNLSQLAYTTPSFVGDLLKPFGRVRDLSGRVTFGRVVRR